jgi:glucuronoarabinoxylan endo-1,4-beta-xylanase
VAAACLVVTPAGAASAGAPPSAPDDAPDVPTAVVDWDAERQHIDGFGGSFAFHKAGSIQRLGEPLSSEILDMIFSDDAGIGLDIARVMIGDGGIDEWGDELYDGPTDTIMPEPGVLVWDQPGWEERKDDFDAHQIWLMREAQERGVDTFLATAWSPPAWMKENGSVVSSGRNGPPNRLRTDMYQQYADYLADYVLGYREQFGIEITHLSPANEPDFSGSYSSSLWTPEELSTFVRDFLGPTFERRDVGATIVLGEGVGYGERHVLPALADPVARSYVGVVASHAYGGLRDNSSDVPPEAFAVSNQLGKPVWMTEFMNQGAPRDRLFVNNTISDGLRYANLVANAFGTSQLSAYFWWWPAANNGSDGSDLIRLVNTGTPQSGNPTETGQYRVFKRYYTLGQYSRFVDDGDVMIDADEEPVDGVRLTAYKDPETGSFTLVAVNDNHEDVEVGVDLTGGFPLPPESREDCRDEGWRTFTDPAFRSQGDCVSAVASGRVAPSAVVPYRTSASENMVKLDDIRTTDRSFTSTLRGQSVTTFVPKAAELPALPDRKDVFSTYLAAENDGASEGLRVATAAGRGEIVTGVDDGSFLRYANVNFADGSAAGFLEQKGQLAMHAVVNPRAGGRIEVRLDDPHTGRVVGTFDVPARTGGQDWVTVSTPIDTDPRTGASGFHDVYLVLTGADGEACSSAPFDVDYLYFSDGPTLDLEPEPAPVPAPVVDPSLTVGERVVQTCGDLDVAIAGYQPGSTVELVLQARRGTRPPTTIELEDLTVGPDGSASVLLPVPADVDSGPYQLVARSGDLVDEERVVVRR